MGTIDAGTIARAREGDPEALGVLWREYQPHVLRYLRAKRTVHVDDVASNVWIDVGASIGRFQGDAADLKRWIFTIAHRRSVDEIRRSVRRNEVLRAAPSMDCVAPGADEVSDVAGALGRAIAMVSRLPADMAEAVMLRVVHELPVSDVAAVMDRTDGHIRVLVHRGLQRLAAMESVTLGRSETMVRVS